ncbi:BQ2448_7776 [Microbotryum intermedium]|uniref:BQ2448_7776 protein n=1 Tax=Microbotryum intermedium TaxID=269621 RepID=A0A238FN84_9BASI|nr:BQ2448_7776 [Microbotryum intermedium]
MRPSSTPGRRRRPWCSTFASHCCLLALLVYTVVAVHADQIVEQAGGSSFSVTVGLASNSSPPSTPLPKLKRAPSEPADGSASAPPTWIPITSTMPSVKELAVMSPTIALFWDAALKSLALATQDGVESTLRSQEFSGFHSKIVGIPGTGIDTKAEAKALQMHLDCMTGNGEWVYDPSGDARSSEAPNPNIGLTVHKQEGIYASCDRKFYSRAKGSSMRGAGWDVRESLKWKWQPSKRCVETAPANARPGLSRRRFCQYLSHKSTILLGDTPHYSLHDLLLDWTTLSPMSCYGDLYCREHSLCGDILKAKPGAAIEDWTEDERVWLNLPRAPSAVLKATAERSDDDDDSDEPHKHEPWDETVIAENGKRRTPSVGTLLRYRRTDGLKSSRKFIEPNFVHPSTGVREVNQQWLPDSRRADIVVMSKAPLPFPLAGHNETFDVWFNELDDSKDLEEVAEKYIEAAWRMTEDVWLPELLESLKLMRGRPSPGDQLIIYRGGWRAHHDCSRSSLDEDDASASWDWRSPGDGPPPHKRQPTLSQLLFRDRAQTRLVDRHTLWFNLQTIMQNHIVRKFIAPKFGLPFLDLESSMSVWRSGMVGGSASAAFEPLIKGSIGESRLVDQTKLKKRGANPGLRNAASGDCSRYCIASPGSGIEEAFIGGLLRIFERGFASTEERKQKWTGDGFSNVKERMVQREKLKNGDAGEDE